MKKSVIKLIMEMIFIFILPLLFLLLSININKTYEYDSDNNCISEVKSITFSQDFLNDTTYYYNLNNVSIPFYYDHILTSSDNGTIFDYYGISIEYYGDDFIYINLWLNELYAFNDDGFMLSYRGYTIFELNPTFDYGDLDTSIGYLVSIDNSSGFDEVTYEYNNVRGYYYCYAFNIQYFDDGNDKLIFSSVFVNGNDWFYWSKQEVEVNKFFKILQPINDGLGIDSNNVQVQIIEIYTILWFIMFVLWHLLYFVLDFLVHLVKRKE